MMLPTDVPFFCKLVKESLDIQATEQIMSRITKHALVSAKDPMEQLFVARTINALYPTNKNEVLQNECSKITLKPEQLKVQLQDNFYSKLISAKESQLNELLLACSKANAIKDVQLYLFTFSLPMIWKLSCIVQFIEGYEL